MPKSDSTPRVIVAKTQDLYQDVKEGIQSYGSDQEPLKFDPNKFHYLIDNMNLSMMNLRNGFYHEDRSIIEKALTYVVHQSMVISVELGLDWNSMWSTMHRQLTDSWLKSKDKNA